MNILKEYDEDLSAAKDLKEFKIIAKQLLLSRLEAGRLLVYAMNLIVFCAHMREKYERIPGALDFGLKVRDSELSICPPVQRCRMIDRMFRRSNPKFTIPKSKVKEYSPQKTVGMSRTWKKSHRTDSLEKMAYAIAEMEAKVGWRQNGDWDNWEEFFDNMYQAVLAKLCWEEDTEAVTQ